MMRGRFFPARRGKFTGPGPVAGDTPTAGCGAVPPSGRARSCLYRWPGLIILILLSFSACAPILRNQGQAVVDPDATLFRFVFTGDSRGNYKADPPVYLEEELLAQVVGHILALEPQPEFVIFNGDMVAKTTFTKAPEKIARWRAIFEEPLRANNIKVYTTPGNHIIDQKERCPTGEICYISKFNQYFRADNPANGPTGYGGVSYSFTRANTHFVTVTSFTSHGGPDNSEIDPAEFVQRKKQFEYFINRPNRDWLEQDLARDRSTFTIFFTHCPLYPVGPHYQDRKSLHAHPANRDAVAGILAADGVDMVFASHEHLYARANIGPANPSGSGPGTGMAQSVVGAASAPLSSVPARPDMRFEKYLSAYGFLVGDVKKDRIECYFYNETGQLLDGFTVPARTGH